MKWDARTSARKSINYFDGKHIKGPNIHRQVANMIR